MPPLSYMYHPTVSGRERRRPRAPTRSFAAALLGMTRDDQVPIPASRRAASGVRSTGESLSGSGAPSWIDRARLDGGSPLRAGAESTGNGLPVGRRRADRDRLPAPGRTRPLALW